MGHAIIVHSVKRPAHATLPSPQIAHSSTERLIGDFLIPCLSQLGAAVTYGAGSMCARYTEGSGYHPKCRNSRQINSNINFPFHTVSLAVFTISQNASQSIHQSILPIRELPSHYSVGHSQHIQRFRDVFRTSSRYPKPVFLFLSILYPTYLQFCQSICACTF